MGHQLCLKVIGLLSLALVDVAANGAMQITVFTFLID